MIFNAAAERKSLKIKQLNRGKRCFHDSFVKKGLNENKHEKMY